MEEDFKTFNIYRCPVCGGNGLVPNGFYNMVEESYYSVSTTPEMCKSCFGKGYILINLQEI